MDPSNLSDKFTCPHCGVLAQQSWVNSSVLTNFAQEYLVQAESSYRKGSSSVRIAAVSDFVEKAKTSQAIKIGRLMDKANSIGTCESCKKTTIWIEEEMVYPSTIPVQEPNSDLNTSIKEIYIEAASILKVSPRGSAALLRLALQELLAQLGKTGNINSSIAGLVQDGLDPKIQKAMDLVRVIGNNAVHPGQIDFDDSSEIARRLFVLINMIAHETITKPREIASLYDESIPEDTKKHIEERDK